eukprot:7254566-Alexandrium_andersonii.AAC.1
MAGRLLDAASGNASWRFHTVSSRARRPPRGQARSVPQGDVGCPLHVRCQVVGRPGHYKRG